MIIRNRRTFFREVLTLAGVSALHGAESGTSAPQLQQTAPSENSGQRQQAALQMRQDAAASQNGQLPADHLNNGDEAALPRYIGSFTKGLPHTQLGEVEPGTYETLLRALSTGKQTDFETLDRGSGSKFVDPMAAYAFQLEGGDSHRFGIPPAPPFSGPEAAAEMVELYWQALARDVPFSQYSTSPIAQTATQDLNGLSAFRGPVSGGRVTAATLFRGSVTGELVGPYLSQFLWQPIPVNSTIIDQQYRVPLAGVDYLIAFPEWLVSQSGVPPYRAWTADPQRRYINNGRALAEWVHYDFLYQAFHNAALILLNQGPESSLNVNPFLNPANPYKSTKVETGFITFGAPHVCCLLGAAAQAALKSAWFQKWMVHRRLRPEAFGGRVHQSMTGVAKYPIHTDLANSAALPVVFGANGNYLLPQSYPEGCPLHPSYPAGHATVAGACSAILKAFFDENQLMTDCVQASADGLSLTPFYDTALTVGGEVNKLAANIAMGRNFAGIHYRSDAEAGFRLGEDVAIALLQDHVRCFAEDFAGFSFTRLDGTRISISSQGALITG